MIPQLNQLCTVKTVTRNHRGTKTESIVASNVKCRFFESSGKIVDGQGEFINYDGYLHIGIDPVIQKGDYIEINSKNYKVEYAGHTRDIQGRPFFQYITLSESA